MEDDRDDDYVKDPPMLDTFFEKYYTPFLMNDLVRIIVVSFVYVYIVL